jgi:hypothetical protein
MKKVFLLLMAALMIIPTAEAKRRETPEEVELKTRHYQGWEWGAQARFDLVFYDMTYSKVFNDAAVKSYAAQAKFGGNVMLNGGYFINNNWKLGLELGAQMQYNYTLMPVAVTAQYFYGKRKTCLFTFVNVGTNMLFNKGVRFGALGEGGVGVRIQSPESKFKYDIILGYQALMLNPRPQGGQYQYNGQDVNFKKVNQSVFIGLGLSF